MAKKILFVVGAGASYEFGLPLGPQLALEISKLAEFTQDHWGKVLSGDREIAEAFKQFIGSQAQRGAETWLTKESEQLSSAVPLAPSIDNYLFAHRENVARVALGKMCLVRALLVAEKRSKLYWDPENTNDRFDFRKVGQTWLAQLFSILATVGDKASFAEFLDTCTFITFNYDRIIERFFFLATQSYFDLDQEEAESFCAEHLEVLHPYGLIEKLLYKNRHSGFGMDAERDDLLSAINNVRLFGEGGNKATQSIVHEKIIEADALIFLGFSFLDINLTYLNPGRLSKFQRVLGTCYGMSSDNVSYATGYLEEGLIELSTFYKPMFMDVEANKLIRDFSTYIRKG